MYAIVDIETTGSHAGQNGITEIAVVLHNGLEVEGRYETLVNPGYTIPRYVAALTGITDQMVASAPRFEEVAPNLLNLLKDRIFIAHNVNFDYSFLRHQFKLANMDWNSRKLCTLRLSRKVFSGLPKYGLGHLCKQLDIPIQNRHRAGGDADATTILFEKIIAQGGEKLVKEFLKKEGREQILPPNLPAEAIKKIPYEPGVYYFHDAKGKVIYVGKAKCLKQRVVSHFTGLDTGKKRQEFLRTIHSVTFTTCSSEFTAAILESIEIKRLWPAFNYSQKRFEQLFGFYVFEDGRGYLRIAIDKKKKHFEPVASFNLLVDAHTSLWKLVNAFELHPALCFLEKNLSTDVYAEPADIYNQKVKAALQHIVEQQQSFAIVEQLKDHHSYVLVEKGKFIGMGKLPSKKETSDFNQYKSFLTAYPENEVIKSMIRQYADKFPDRVVSFDAVICQ
ncbi:MAG: polymerase epsilon subunit [Chitinophagaceae bacterium]|nr:polymerase epsilon subunit [Chitinophagaceae bacterium]